MQGVPLTLNRINFVVEDISEAFAHFYYTFMSERELRLELFSDSVGSFINPVSHRGGEGV